MSIALSPRGAAAEFAQFRAFLFIAGLAGGCAYIAAHERARAPVAAASEARAPARPEASARDKALAGVRGELQAIERGIDLRALHADKDTARLGAGLFSAWRGLLANAHTYALLPEEAGAVAAFARAVDRLEDEHMPVFRRRYCADMSRMLAPAGLACRTGGEQAERIVFTGAVLASAEARKALERRMTADRALLGYRAAVFEAGATPPPPPPAPVPEDSDPVPESRVPEKGGDPPAPVLATAAQALPAEQSLAPAQTY